MKNNIIDSLYFILSLAVIVFIFINIGKCNRNKYKELDLKNSEFVSDTVFKSSTLIITDTIYKYKKINTFNTSTITNTYSVYVTNKDSINIYKRFINDSTLDLMLIDTLFGTNIGSSIDYTIKLPKELKIITSTVTVTNNIKKDYAYNLITGMEIGKNNISPYLDFKINNKLIGYRYNTLDKSHNVKVGIVIFKK